MGSRDGARKPQRKGVRFAARCDYGTFAAEREGIRQIDIALPTNAMVEPYSRAAGRPSIQEGKAGYVTGRGQSCAAPIAAARGDRRGARQHDGGADLLNDRRDGRYAAGR